MPTSGPPAAAAAFGTAPHERLGLIGLLRTRGFHRLLAVRFTTQWADGMFQAALGGAVLFNPERQADPLAVAAGLAVLLLPYSLIGPFAGALLDRWDRRMVLIAANLILAARRRGAGLTSVLEGLAESVAADVRARRQVEADRAKPRSTARWVTVISASVLVVLALSGSYVRPYGSPIGQVILVVLLAAYVATLVWMRRMASGKPLPRFLDRRSDVAVTP